MSLFDDDPDDARRRDLGGLERTDISDWTGHYLGYTVRGDTVTDAITPTEGYVGKYDHASDTTFDWRGNPIGKGNWLMTFFRRG